ncbi:hypothetical protein SEVIR_1G355900v4 [Setaria viridis]|uniref:RING-type domain-containing protein n=2 Tax=Setaria viridis TaxID=4556 RepID=A0A4U6WH00_SETVI|nr:uncharacterized protein LOC117841226 [Setaria viridis]TKW42012.1 hypothetical protein SEVIR_1G355900v2 [Setaria viridis]
MPRASRVSNPPAAAAAAPAAAARNVSSNAGHSTPSCSAPVYQPFRPVTRSMTCVPAPIVASPDLKEGGSASTSTRRSISDASFIIQSAASRPTVTHARTPHKVTSSGWKPLTQPVALSEERKCASLTTAKRSRVTSSRAVKDLTNHSASKANINVPSGNKYRDEENISQGELDGVVMPSPPKKLQTCKDPSDSPSIRKSTIRILGAKRAAFLPTGKSEVETGKNLASVPAKVVSASTNVISESVDASVPLLAQQQQPGTAKISNAVTQAIANETSQLNQLAAAIITLPKQNLQTDYEKKPASLPIVPNQVSQLGGATAPLVAPKLEIGKGQNTSNLLSNPAYARALLIKQQEQLLQQYKSGTPQPQQHHIKGPALFETDEPPPVEPLGTRCQLCKLDVAFRPQGDAGRDANAPPVVAVLACHHAFHSSCIESIYGLAEPAECLACLEHGAVH